MDEHLIPSETRFVRFRDVANGAGHKACDELFIDIANKLTEALNLIPGSENLQIQYRNILERDCNPDGLVCFFRIIHRDLLNGTVPFLTPNIPPHQPGDTEEVQRFPEA